MVQDRVLARIMREFAETMLNDFAVDSILSRLVAGVVEALPVESAGVVLLEPDEVPRSIAASDARARELEELEARLGQGPCLTAYRCGELVVADVRAHTPFPLYAARARALGLCTVASLPLRHREQVLGVLDLYDLAGTGVDPRDLEAAQALADVAAAYVVNARARVELQSSAERLRVMALHDPLTGLPNRVLFAQRLDHGLQRAARSRRLLAALFVDLDHFKAVNDLYGHAVGDELLVAVARRLERVLRPGDTLARLAGDEFAVLCEDLDDAAEADGVASRIRDQLQAPFVLAENAHPLTASIGIAFAASASTSSAEEVLHNADAAMYRAKRAGGGHHRVIDLRAQIEDRTRRLQADLGTAVENDELYLRYQPIVAAADADLCGVEALVRWRHPREGEVPATTLVALAEETGLIRDVGRWVLRQALADHERWRWRTHPLSLFVNVAPAELMGRRYVGDVADVLEQTGIDPANLVLEVTETAFLADPDRALVVLRDLHHLGVRIAMDDFGTGYSSLTYLHRFPVDIVKIDRSFVSALGHPNADRLVNAIIGLAHDLHLIVVAEGVETSQQHEELAERDCDFVQGYHFGGPQTAAAIDHQVAP